MDTTYANVAVKAILPALLYFTGIFLAVHLEARRLNLKGIPRDQLPKFGILIRSIYLLLPLVVLVWMVSTGTRTLQYSASIAILLAILVSLPHIFADSRTQHNHGGAVPFVKDTAAMIVHSLEAGGRSCITVAVACSMAGMVAGCITVTGLASKLINAVVNISGMVPNEALSKSDPMKTGVNATKLAIAAFIVPYIFAYSPAMLFVDVTSVFQVIQIVVSALLGIFGVAAALNGFLFRPIPRWMRLALVVAGLAMMIPGDATDVVGLAVLAVLVFYQRAMAKKGAATA